MSRSGSSSAAYLASVCSASVRSSGGASDRSAQIRLSCNLHTWQRIQSLVKGVQMSGDKLQKIKDEMESEEVSRLLEAHSMASEIANLRVLNEIKASKIDRLKRICARKRLKIAQLQEDQEIKDSQMKALRLRCEQMDRIIMFAKVQLQRKQKYAYAYSRLVRHRSRLLLTELKEIFRIELRDIPLGQKSCTCRRVDLICGVHLPSINMLKGHNEMEFTAALGYLVQLLDCISWILDYNFRYPMTEISSNSEIYSPIDEKTFPLYGTHWRADRGKLEISLSLLGKNIAQLRSDTGLSSSHLGHYLQTVREWLEVVIRGKGDVKFLDRPWRRIGTPAMLMDDLDEERVASFVKPEPVLLSPIQEMQNGHSELSLMVKDLDTSATSSFSFEEKYIEKDCVSMKPSNVLQATE